MSVYGQVPTPAADGATTAFSLGQPYAPATTRVYVGGARKELGTDYVETDPAGGGITMAAAPAAGVEFVVDFDVQATATTTAQGTWTFNPDGYPPGSVMYYGPTLWLSGSDPGQTGTGVCVFGPSGAQISVPAMAAGEPGQSVSLTVGTVATLATGSPVTFELVETNPGGAGIGSAYTVNIGIPEGAQGAAYATQIINASDLTGTPAAGYTIVYVPAQGNTPAQMAYAAMPFASVYNVVDIPDTGTNGGGNRTLASLSIPAMPFLWVPDIEAQATVAGTSNTQVDLVGRLNDGGSAFQGTQVALGDGQLGPGPATVATQMAYDSLVSGDAGSPVIPANTSVEIYLNAEEQTGTLDEYSTSDATFTVKVLPVGIIASASVALDLTGPGLSVAAGTGTLAFTAGADDNYVIAALAVASADNLYELTSGLQYGSVAMNSLGGTQAVGDCFVQLYGLADPPAGPQTVTPNVTGGTVDGIVCQLVSFQSWSQTSFAYLTGGDGESLTSDPVVINAGQIAFCAMVSLGADPIEVTSANTTTVWAQQAGAANLNLVLLMASGTGGAVEFTATTAASQPWASALVTLI